MFLEGQCDLLIRKFRVVQSSTGQHIFGRRVIKMGKAALGSKKQYKAT